MAEQNKKHENEDRAEMQGQDQPSVPQQQQPAAKSENEDDVQAYGEPSDGSGGTVKGG